MFVLSNVFDVEEHGICDLHQPFKLRKPRALACKRLCRCVKTSVDAACMGFLEEFYEKVYLQQSFTSTDRDSTFLTPIGAVFLGLIKQFIGRHRPCLVLLPSVGIVAKQASHGAAL